MTISTTNYRCPPILFFDFHGFSVYHWWKSSTACTRSTNFTGSHVSQVYQIHRIKYCNWIPHTQRSSPFETCYSSSPSTSPEARGATTYPSDGSSRTGFKCEVGCTEWILIDTGNSYSHIFVDTGLYTLNGPKRFQSHNQVGRIVRILRASNPTLNPTSIFPTGIRPWFARWSCNACRRPISPRKRSWTRGIVAWTWSASRIRWSHCCVGSLSTIICELMPSSANNGVHCVDLDVPSFAANSALVTTKPKRPVDG